jgi:hypothetical protein
MHIYLLIFLITYKYQQVHIFKLIINTSYSHAN